jgi:2-phosphosulfolactate phosphatase
LSRFIDIAILPAEAAAMESGCFVVVDVLRATTNIATMFSGGLQDVIVADSEARARDIAKRDGRLLCGEVHGLPPEGFDHGNSPLEIREAAIAGRSAVLFTTNGTKAFCAVAGRGRVLAGALANLEAVAMAAAKHETVTVVCAGNAGGERFALEDFATAAEIVQRVLVHSRGAETGDAAGLALDTMGYEDWIAASLPQQTDKSARALRASAHGRRTAEIGFAGDVHFAAQRNTSVSLPEVVEFGDGWARLENRA